MIDGGRLALLRLSSNKIMMRTPPLRTAAESLADVQSTGAKNISSITQCRSHLLLLLRIFECRLRLETTSLPSARSPLSWPRFPVPLSMSLPQPMAPADCTTDQAPTFRVWVASSTPYCRTRATKHGTPRTVHFKVLCPYCVCSC